MTSRSVTLMTVGGIHLVRICRNPLGEYFHVMIDGDRERVKHMPVDHARMVIRQFPEAYAREFGDTT